MRVLSILRAFSLALLTPLLEKSALKIFAVDVALVFSMSRIIVLGFAWALLHQIWRAGVAGWPEATLAIAIVLALPMLGALERVPPEQVLAYTRLLFDRLGNGAVRKVTSAYAGPSPEPSKFDDHRDDSP